MSPPRRRISKDRHKRIRSRSRSRDRRRHEIRSRSRSRDRTRRHRSRSPRFRSRSPRNRSYEKHKSRERSKDRKLDKPHPYTISNQQTEEIVDLTDLSTDEKDMMKMMGFCSFDTTKGKKVDGNDVGEVHVILKRKYRQYMNRKGGFNRPLDFVA